MSGPAFYSYTSPEPSGYSEFRVSPDPAYYHPTLREFVLMYDDIRSATDPKRLLLDFCQTTYEAGATLGNWDRASLER